MNMGVSPITRKIYAGKSKSLLNGKGQQWVGQKRDVTDEAIKAVFEYMYLKAEKTGFYEIGIEGYGVMAFARKSGGAE